MLSNREKSPVAEKLHWPEAPTREDNGNDKWDVISSPCAPLDLSMQNHLISALLLGLVQSDICLLQDTAKGDVIVHWS